MNGSLIQEQAKFKQSLVEFLIATGTIKSAEFAFQFNPFNLYKNVCKRGGYQAICNRKEWHSVASELSSDDPLKIKRFYLRFMLPYEKKHYFGIQGQEELPYFISSAPRKMIKGENGGRQVKVRGQELVGLQDQIARGLQEDEKNRKQYYLNKNKLSPNKAQSKKIILGLQTFMERKDQIYSLNMLMLYSVNAHFPFLFQNHEKIFLALQSYLYSIYPPKDTQQMEDLRTITLILRNLTLNPLNLKHILGTPTFTLLVTIFNTGLDHECSRNIVDTMTGLVKVGWDCQRIVTEIGSAALQGVWEDVEMGVELLRGLVEQREQSLAAAVTSGIKNIIRIFLATEVSIDVKEQMFEVLAFVTDVSSQSRQEFLKNSTLMGIIIGVLQHMRNYEKLIQFAALTLSNMSSSSIARLYLKQYETPLMMIGFTDDSLAGIIANILSDIALESA